MKSRLPKGYGSGSATNMNQIAKQAQKIQEEMEKVSAELEEKEYTATTGGNAVSVTMLGSLQITNLTISPEVIDPEDSELLADMITGAVNEVIRNINADKEEKMNAVTGGLSLPGMGF
ncbi:MAG: YbaB/EbfC family nucleoid-associated protein [Firmicutes bacterium]|nr:YbaB/EbfC family nucleoid-associated protein [Bacillota bacterium]